MRKIYYYFPHLLLCMITVLYIETGIMNNLTQLLLHTLVVLIVVVSLEVKRNQFFNLNKRKMSSFRKVLFIMINITLGIFVGTIWFVISLPLAYLNPMEWNMAAESILLLTPLQSYVFIGFVSLWFILNAVIIRINHYKKALFLLSSLLIMAIVPFINYVIYLFKS